MRERMRIKDLRPKAKADNIELKIIEKRTIKEVTTKFGVPSKVCEAIGVDDIGDRVTVSLWNDEIDKVNVNERIRITNGWVTEWRGNLQLSAGKLGKLEKL